MDLSCGSGLFTRRFVGSNKFKGVIAADYSESMLQQTKELFNKDELLDRRSAPTEITGFIAHADCLSVYEMFGKLQNTGFKHRSSTCQSCCNLCADFLHSAFCDSLIHEKFPLAACYCHLVESS